MPHPDPHELIRAFSYAETVAFKMTLKVSALVDKSLAAFLLCQAIDPYTSDPTPDQMVWVERILFPTCEDTFAQVQKRVAVLKEVKERLEPVAEDV